MLSITKVERLKLGRVLQLEPIGKVLAPEIVRDEKLDAPTNTRDQECSSLLNLLIRQARTIALACYLAERASNANVRVSIERHDHNRWRSIEDAFAWIEQSLAANHPVLVYFAEEPDHYTVIAGTTPTRLQLFDSAGTGFVHKAGCDLRSGTHIIWPNGLLRVVVKPPG